MANSVGPDEMQHSIISDLGLHCLLRPVCLNPYSKYGSAELSFLFIIEQNLNQS